MMTIVQWLSFYGVWQFVFINDVFEMVQYTTCAVILLNLQCVVDRLSPL